MGIWWRSRQWVYARPHVAAGGTIIVLLLVGAGGWESARRLTSSGGSLDLAAAPVVHDRQATPAARPAKTVVITHRVAVPRVVARGQTRTVTHERTLTIVKRSLAVRTLRERPAPPETVRVTTASTRTVTVRAIQRHTVTEPVTVIRPVTVIQAVTVTETIKRGKGH